MSNDTDLQQGMWASEALSVEDILLAAVDLARRKRAGDNGIEPPLLHLILRGGSHLDGYVLDVKRPEGGDCRIAFWPEDACKSQRDTVAYLAMRDVVVAVLHGKHRFDETREALAAAQPLSSLQLRRKLAELGEELSSALGQQTGIEIDEQDLSDSPEERGRIGRTLAVLVERLASLATDEFSRKTVTGALNSLAVGKHAGPGLSIEEGSLRVDPWQLATVSPHALGTMLNELL